jgi:hypothetical protein
MKKLLPIIILFMLYSASYGQEELKIWKEFIFLVKNGQLTESRIKPLDQLGDKFKPILLGYLDSIRVQTSPDDWTKVPEIIKIDNRIQFIVPWSARGQTVNYCFSFVKIDSQWFFQHLESIFIRLDKLSPLPVSTFPDISEPQKAWAREETYWSFIVLNIYLPLSSEKGKEYALNLLKDGGGYFVGAKTWVPFASPNRAFVLYLCWEQANLRGNNVTLLKLTDTQAIVQLETQFFYLYFNAAHLKPKISIEDYKQIFETIWQDRAKNAGWDLDIKYSSDYKVEFDFNRDK